MSLSSPSREGGLRPMGDNALRFQHASLLGSGPSLGWPLSIIITDR